MLRHGEVNVLPTKCALKVIFIKKALSHIQLMHRPPCCQQAHTGLQHQLLGEGLEAAAHPHGAHWLQSPPKSVERPLLQAGAFAGAYVATQSFAVGMELGGHPRGCTPSAQDNPDGEALKQCGELCAPQRQCKTRVEQLGAAHH